MFSFSKKTIILFLLGANLFTINLFANYENVSSKKDAARFLTQATFGPSKKAINNLVKMETYESWIENQIKKKPTLLAPKILKIKNEIENNPNITRKILREQNRQAVWINSVIYGKDQLRQRMAYALSEILVTGFTQGFANRQYERAVYYDILIKNAFGSYKDLLTKITLNPIMGKYLSMLNNKKANESKNTHPDENFAREIMQLFTIGLVKLNEDASLKDNIDIASYNQDDIENLARVFTGWKLDSKDYSKPMICKEEDHDTKSKVLFEEANFIVSGENSCRKDLDEAIEILFNHPNTAPFISKQLIQKFTTSNPSSTYVRDVSRVFSSTNGNLGEVIKAILLHEEARKPRDIKTDTFGKFKEPMIKLIGFLRAHKIEIDKNKISGLKEILGQTYLDAPSVFNYFRPSFKIDSKSDLLTPELELFTDSYAAKTANFYFNKALNFNCKKVNNFCLKLNKELKWAKNNVSKFIEHYNLLLFAGNMSEDLKEKLHSYITSIEYSENISESKKEQITKKRVSHALFFMTNSAEQNFQQ